jgi:hypothetical protein
MHIDLHLAYSLLNFCKIWDGKKNKLQMWKSAEKWNIRVRNI